MTNDSYFGTIAPMFSKELTRHLRIICEDESHPITVMVQRKNQQGQDMFDSSGDPIMEEVVSWDNVLYHINHLWKPVWFGEKQLFIRDPCMNYYRADNGDIVRCMMACLLKKGFTVKSGKVKSTVDLVVNHVSAYPFGNSHGFLNFSNGVLDTNTMVMSTNTTDVLFDYVVATAYSRFDDTPELDTFLATYGDAGKEVIAVTAKALWQRCLCSPLKEITVWYGIKDSGKTSLAELPQATLDGDLHSKRNTSRVLLGDLLQRFGTNPLEHKLINIGDDLPDQFIKGAGKLNELVGSVHHNIEHKGVDSYPGLITAYCLFTANNLPPLDDDDFVLWSKIHLVRFGNKLSRGTPVEPLYTDIVKMQLLSRAVDLMVSWKTTPYVNSQSAEEVRAIWHEASTSVEAFMARCLIFDTQKVTPLEDIKSVYEKWCIKNGKHPYIKFLVKKLQSYQRRTAAANGYMVTITTEADLGDIELPNPDTRQIISTYTETTPTT
jgi:phage/plasmid-associated DNA primase